MTLKQFDSEWDRAIAYGFDHQSRTLDEWVVHIKTNLPRLSLEALQYMINDYNHLNSCGWSPDVIRAIHEELIDRTLLT